MAVPDREAVEKLAERVRASRLPPVEERALIRRAAHLPLREIAEALGVTPATVHRWETGYAVPRTDHAIAYADVLRGLKKALEPTPAEHATETQEGTTE